MATRDQIYIDQIKLLNESIPRGQLLNMVIALAFAVVMQMQSSKAAVIAWLALLYFVSFIRHLLHKYYFPPANNKPVTDQTRQWPAPYGVAQSSSSSRKPLAKCCPSP